MVSTSVPSSNVKEGPFSSFTSTGVVFLPIVVFISAWAKWAKSKADAMLSLSGGSEVLPESSFTPSRVGVSSTSELAFFSTWWSLATFLGGS